MHTKIDNLTMAIAASGHSRSLLDCLSNLEKQEDGLLTQLERIKKVSARTPLDYSYDTLVSYAQQLSEKLRTDDLNIRRRALQALLHEILIDRQNKDLICQITIYIGAGNYQDENFLHKMSITFPVANHPQEQM